VFCGISGWYKLKRIKYYRLELSLAIERSIHSLCLVKSKNTASYFLHNNRGETRTWAKKVLDKDIEKQTTLLNNKLQKQLEKQFGGNLPPEIYSKEILKEILKKTACDLLICVFTSSYK
jgi:hypothetical protein